MLDAARTAVKLVRGRRREDLDADTVLALALTRLLEIVGEASVHVSEAVRSAHPEIRWRAAAATRDRLVHGYYDVDLDVVWGTVRDDLPVLVGQLERLIGPDA